MKNVIVVVFVGLVFGFSTKPIFAGSFFDDFNDGNTAGWIMGASCSSPSWCGVGNWRLENGYITQNLGGDGYMFLLDNYTLTDHIIEAKVLWHDNGGAGLAIWRQDDDNWVTVTYPTHDSFTVIEKWCDIPLCPRDDNVTRTVYSHHFPERIWQTLKLDANSLTGEIAVYLEGEYLFTHTVGANIRRMGLSGFTSGNAGGSFDDVLITSDSIIDPLTVKAQCKDGGWEKYGFANQGSCVKSLMKQLLADSWN